MAIVMTNANEIRNWLKNQLAALADPMLDNFRESLEGAAAENAKRLSNLEGLYRSQVAQLQADHAASIAVQDATIDQLRKSLAEEQSARIAAQSELSALKAKFDPQIKAEQAAKEKAEIAAMEAELARRKKSLPAE